MVMGKLSVPGRPIIWITVGQGPTALAVCAGGAVWAFLLSTILSLSLWGMARYRLKYCLKGPLNPKQPTNNQPRVLRNPSYHTSICIALVHVYMHHTRLSFIRLSFQNPLHASKTCFCTCAVMHW